MGLVDILKCGGAVMVFLLICSLVGVFLIHMGSHLVALEFVSKGCSILFSVLSASRAGWSMVVVLGFDGAFFIFIFCVISFAWNSTINGSSRLFLLVGWGRSRGPCVSGWALAVWFG